MLYVGAMVLERRLSHVELRVSSLRWRRTAGDHRFCLCLDFSPHQDTDTCSAHEISWHCISEPPNKRLKLAGGDRIEGSGVLCAGGHGVSATTLAPAGEWPAAYA